MESGLEMGLLSRMIFKHEYTETGGSFHLLVQWD